MTIYLYVKTHNKTGLKYLGRTIRSDPHQYPGSGMYWRRHLKQHGVDYSTEILRECETMEEVAQWGLYYSNLWNVVESDDWANLIPETGTGSGRSADGYGYVVPETTRQRISNTMKGRPAHNKGLKQPHKPHKPRASQERGPSPLKGRIRPRRDCPHCGKSIDEANYHRYHGDKCKAQTFH